ncbi:MAG TPA: hypothetical protein VEF06_12420 [Bryobacteraceae bacterium]|nr:hypothetical protein [Bryobacteraceae bacterium]
MLRPPASPWPRLLPGLSLLVFILIVVAVNSVTQTHRLLRLGTAVHAQCAVAGTYPKQTDRQQMVQALGPYSLMLQPILDLMPGDKVISAHRCTIEGHGYMHVILDHQGKPVSITMTRRDPGDVFPRIFSGGFYSSPAAVRETDLDGYSVAGFTAGRYLGYVVSSMPAGANLDLAERLAPVIRRYTGA